MSLAAFQAQGLTYAIAAGNAAVQVSTAGQQGLYVANPNAQAVFLAFGSSAVTAAAPTTAAPSTGLCLPAGRERTYSIPPGCYMAAATTGGAATVYATPGYGL